MNIEAIRKDTLGCERGIFLNSAGASLMPNPVVQTMKAYLEKEELAGGYTTAINQASAISEFYTEVANYLNAKPHNIAYAYNATDAFAKALSSIHFQPGDYILTTHDDYSSNQIAFLSLQKTIGIQLLKARNLENGDIDLNHFEELAVKHRPKLVAVTHIPTNSGIIQPVNSIGNICNRLNIWYLLDACQSVGQLPLDVSKIQCDFLSATGRKFLRGPRGTGFLYVSDKALNEGLEPLYIDNRGADLNKQKNSYKAQDSAKRFEQWEYSMMSLVGLTEAIKYLNTIGIEHIYNYNQKLMQKFRQGLSQINNLFVLDVGSDLSNIVTLYKKNTKLLEFEKLLKTNLIDYTVSHKNYAAENIIEVPVEWVVRFSPHYFNTNQELQKVIDILR